MEELMKKSIFVQREKFEDIKFCITESSSIFMPNRTDRTYKTQKIDFDNAIVIKEVTIPMPLLEVDDSFYFEDEKRMVKIQEVMRTDKDNVVYAIDNKTTYTAESLEQYEADKQTYLDNKQYKINAEMYKKQVSYIKNELEELRDMLEAKNKKKIKELTKSLITDINNRGI